MLKKIKFYKFLISTQEKEMLKKEPAIINILFISKFSLSIE